MTKTLCKLRSLQGVNLRKYRSFKRLVDMFGDITHIEQSKHDIAAYINVSQRIKNCILKTIVSF